MMTGRLKPGLQRKQAVGIGRLLRFMALLLASGVCLIAATATVADDAPSDAGIRSAIRDLGSTDFPTRELATQRLWQMGPWALPALEEARKSSVLEVGRRARWLIERIASGVTPQTPQPLVALVRSWHLSLRNRETVIKELVKHGEAALPILRGLSRSTEDARLRDQLESAIYEAIRSQIWSAMESGDLLEAEAMLRRSRTDRKVMRHYATFFLLTGQITQEIEQIQTDWAETHDVALGELLVLCLRAAGQRDNALRVGQQLDGKVWLDGLQIEAGRWSDLVHSKATWPTDAVQRVRPRLALRTVRDRGFYAACLRLAGMHRDSERMLARIGPVTQNDPFNNRPPDVRDQATVLLINHRPAAAIDVLTNHARKSHLQRSLAFNLLCLQDRYETAFELAELTVPDARQKAVMKSAFAKQLAGLGERDRAVALLTPMIEQAGNDSSNSTRTLIKTLIAIGEVSEGLRHVARRLKASITDSQKRTELQAVYTASAHYGRRPNPIGWLQPKKNVIAIQRLWELIPECFPEDPPDWQLARLRHLIGLPVEHEWTQEDRLQAARQAVELSRRKGGEKLPFRLQAVAYALLRLNELEQARELLRSAAGLTQDAAPVTRIADSLATEKKWSEAADWYHRASEKSPKFTFLEFAEGWCRHEAGDATGEDMMNRACLWFLGKTADRFRAIDAHVNDRGWNGARHRLAQLTLRTDVYGSVYTMNASGTLGNTVSKTQPRLAVQMWERLQLGLTAPDTFVSEYEQILVSQETLQRVKARDLSQRGRVSELLTAIETARRTIPGSELVALEFVPFLQEWGHNAEVDRLLEQITARNLHVLSRYPSSHRHHYRLARLSMHLGWRVDDGLRHAQAAVDLVPNHPAYQRTLKKLSSDVPEPPTQ